jgi:hypothetical protein
MQSPEMRQQCAVTTVGATSVTLTPIAGRAQEATQLKFTSFVINTDGTPHSSWVPGESIKVLLRRN